MIGWIILGVYLLGFLLCWRMAAGLIAYGEMYGDRPDWGFGLGTGAFVALVWPIAFPALVAIHRMKVTHGLSRMLYVPPDERRKALERRISELERDAGMRP